MAYWIQELSKSNGRQGVKSFYCDFRSDIQYLPTQMHEGDISKGDSASTATTSYGSDCFCLEDGSVWILGKETDQWKEV